MDEKRVDWKAVAEDLAERCAYDRGGDVPGILAELGAVYPIKRDPGATWPPIEDSIRAWMAEASDEEIHAGARVLANMVRAMDATEGGR